MQQPNCRHTPYRYFFSTILVTWVSFFLATYCSLTQELESHMVICLLPSLVIPFIVAMIMIYGSKTKALNDDFKHCVFNVKFIKSRHWFTILLIMPLVILLVTAVAFLVGQPANQFNFPSDFAILSGATFFRIAILFLAPTFEEFAWRIFKSS